MKIQILNQSPAQIHLAMDQRLPAMVLAPGINPAVGAFDAEYVAKVEKAHPAFFNGPSTADRPLTICVVAEASPPPKASPPAVVAPPSPIVVPSEGLAFTDLVPEGAAPVAPAEAPSPAPDPAPAPEAAPAPTTEAVTTKPGRRK